MTHVENIACSFCIDSITWTKARKVKLIFFIYKTTNRQQTLAKENPNSELKQKKWNSICYTKPQIDNKHLQKKIPILN